MNEEIDLDYIIKLVSEQEPERKDIIDALRKCKTGKWDGSGYYRFVNTSNANLPGAVWQHEECIVLEQDNDADIVLDILKDGRIGGIEFIGLIENY